MTVLEHAWAIALSVGVLLPACALPDRFPCGVTDEDGDKVCDGKHEVCVCGNSRCAQRTPNASCPSGLRYVFADQGESEPACVELEDAQTAIDQLSLPEADRSCPVTVQAECGELDPDGVVMRCGTDQACSCADYRCAERHSQCEYGWRWSTTEVCLTSDKALDLESSPPNKTTGLCNGAGYPEQCGVPGFEGIPSTCPPGTSCICNVLACGVPSPECTESGWAYANEFDIPEGSDGCIELPAGEAIEPPQSTGICE